jgi:hypothetical protein
VSDCELTEKINCQTRVLSSTVNANLPFPAVRDDRLELIKLAGPVRRWLGLADLFPVAGDPPQHSRDFSLQSLDKPFPLPVLIDP